MADPQHDRDVGQEDLPTESQSHSDDQDHESSSSKEARTAEQLPSEQVPGEEHDEAGRSDRQAEAEKLSGWRSPDSAG